MKRFFTPLCLLLFLMSSSLSAQFCEALFEYDILPDNQVAFYNASFSQGGPIEGYYWDFGMNVISQDENPVVVFPNPGTYDACLTVFTSDSCASTYCSAIEIEGTATGDCDPTFFVEYWQDTSTGLWNIGLFPANPNQSISWSVDVEFSPNQFYYILAEPGEYEICMIVDGVDCVEESCQIIVIPDTECSADFDFEISDTPPYYLGAFAYNYSEIYYWTVFTPNGGLDSLVTTDQFVEIDNPVAGDYQICLTVVDGDCTDYNCQSVSLDEPNPSDCTAQIDYTNDGNDYYFSAVATGVPPFTYEWYLFDGNVYNQQSVTYTFPSTPNGGVYDIGLVVTDSEGCVVDQVITIVVEDTGNDDCASVISGASPYAQEDSIFQMVIADDAWCCTNGWDNLCQGAYDEIFDELYGGTDSTDCDAYFEFETSIDFLTGENIIGLYPEFYNQTITWNVPVDLSPNGAYSLFVEDGVYNICMTAWTANCTETFCQDITVGDIEDCSADFGLEIDDVAPYYISAFAFNDYDTYYWNIFSPDGGLDSLITADQYIEIANPMVGDYEICLTVFDGNCSDYVCETVVIGGSEIDDCDASFDVEWWQNDDGTFYVSLYPSNLNQELVWSVDAQLNAIGTYAYQVDEAGQYEVCLTAYTENCNDGDCVTFTLVGDPIDEECATIVSGSSPYAATDSIFQQVIAQDTWCCNISWDGICQGQYDELAGIVDTTTGNSDDCTTILNGSSPYGADDAVFQQVISQDPWCCNNGWDALCQCQYDDLSGVTIGDSTTVNTICGDVFGGSPVISEQINGVVYLVAFDPINLTLTALDTAIFNAGDPSFCFELSDGDLNNQSNLYLKAALNEDSPYYESLLPTYYNGALLWYNAQPVYPGDGYTIFLTPGINPGGAGFIGGDLVDGPGKTAADFSGIPVLLLNLDRTPVAYIMSNEDGSYDFSGLPFGTYQLIPDVLGQRINPIIVTISEANPSVTDTEFTIEATATDTGIQDVFTQATNISVYPNPTTDRIQFQIQSDQSQRATIVLYNVLGQTMESNTTQLNAGNNDLRLSTAGQNTGIYFLEVSLEDGAVFSSKIVKR